MASYKFKTTKESVKLMAAGLILGAASLLDWCTMLRPDCGLNLTCMVNAAIDYGNCVSDSSNILLIVRLAAVALFAVGVYKSVK